MTNPRFTIFRDGYISNIINSYYLAQNTNVERIILPHIDVVTNIHVFRESFDFQVLVHRLSQPQISYYVPEAESGFIPSKGYIAPNRTFTLDITFYNFTVLMDLQKFSRLFGRSLRDKGLEIIQQKVTNPNQGVKFVRSKNLVGVFDWRKLFGEYNRRNVPKSFFKVNDPKTALYGRMQDLVLARGRNLDNLLKYGDLYTQFKLTKFDVYLGFYLYVTTGLI